MINQFTYNNIAVTVNDDKDAAYIEFDDIKYPSNKRRFKLLNFEADFNTQTIKTVFEDQVIDPTNNQVIQKSIVKRTMQQPYFDTFYSLNYNLSIGTISVRGCLNNQLENMKSFFGEPVTCYDFFNEYKFFKPIQMSVTYTSEDQGNDATITVTIPNSEGNTYQYSIDGVTFQASNVFEGLVNSVYMVYVKDVTQSTSLGFDVVKTKTITVGDDLI